MPRDPKSTLKSVVRRVPGATNAAKSLRRRRAASATKSVRKGSLEAHLTAAFESGSPQAIAGALAELHALQAHAERLASPKGTPADVRIRETSGVQSAQFMIDLLPHLQKKIATFPRGQVFDVLDIGPGTGLGTALLAELYSAGRLGYRMRVKAIDISPAYQYYLPALTHRVPFVKDDIFVHKARYDFVIASHVIEHVPDPVAFVKRMQELARVAAYVVAPFNEPADNLTRGHVNVIDAAMVEKMEPTWHLEVNSVSWGAFHEPPYEMLIAELPGLAS